MPKYKRLPDSPCSWHTIKKLGYTDWHADAERRAANGEKQVKCKTCGYYIWPDQFGEDPNGKRRKDAAPKV